MATTVVRTLSARFRRSSSQSGKYKPCRSWDRQIQCPCVGVELTLAVSVCAGSSVRRCAGRSQPAQGIGFRTQQGVDESRQQFAQHVGVSGGESFSHQLRPVDIVGGGQSRRVLRSSDFGRSLEESRDDPHLPGYDQHPEPVAQTL